MSSWKLFTTTQKPESSNMDEPNGPIAYLETAIQAENAQGKGPNNPQPSFTLLARVAASLWFVVMAMLFARGLANTVHAVPPGSTAFAIWAPVLSQSCTLIFFITLGWLVLVRSKAVARKEGVIPTTIAFFGTYSVWLMPFLPRAAMTPTLQMISAAVTLVGSLSIIFAVLYLGKSFSIAPQARRLVVGGPYRVVRHPLYVAEEIATIGVLMQYTWYAAVPFLIFHLALQFRRMDYEESLLRAVFPDYEAYALRTARLIPGLW
jgi:protein-S-isoprenylcysteine O-methyltransferase Ste14